MTSSAPLISVVIPTIAYDEYCSQSIKSVCEQNYENWQIVLVLDGAPIKDVPQWVKEHERIKIVEQKIRQGTPTSLNNGIKASDGQLIARLDSDDLAAPSRLSKQEEFLRNHPYIICVATKTKHINEHGKIFGQSADLPTSQDIRQILLVKNPIIHSSVMYRKQVVEQIGGYSLEMTRSQDYELFLRLSKIGAIGYLDESLSSYRIHGGQHSRKTSPFKKYTWIILKRRMELASFLKRSPVRQIFLNFIWYDAQVTRYLGLRKAGFMTGYTPDRI